MNKHLGKLFKGVLRLCFAVVCVVNFIASSFGWLIAIMSMQYNQDLDWSKLFFCWVYILWPMLSIALLLYVVNRLNIINFARLAIFPLALIFSLLTATGGPTVGLLYVSITFLMIIVIWNFLLSCLLRHSKCSCSKRFNAE
jgi:hypothetical protein